MRETPHAAIATVNEDGTPHNTPVFAAFDESLNMYWSSQPDSLHSKNIERTGRVFIILFGPSKMGGGLYIDANARRLGSETEIKEGLKTYNAARKRHSKKVLDEDFSASSPQLLYCANPGKLYVNMSEKDEEGNIIRDIRYKVGPEDLTKL